MPERLTSEQATATVVAMRMSQTLKDALLVQWRLGDPGARFVIYNAWRRAR